MKLSTTQIPANLQDMKLQGIRPLKRLTKKLLHAKPIRVTRSHSEGKSGGQSAAESTRALIDKVDNKRTKVFLNLLLVRPWVLVLGFWLFSMMVGSLALGGMLSPRKLTQALPEPTAVESSQTGNSAINVEKAADELAIEGGAPIAVDTELDEGAVTAADSSSGFPVLPLVVLVGSCAAGSLLISRRRAMMRMSAARAKGRVRQVRQPLNSKATKNQPLKGQPLKSQILKSQNAPAKVSKDAKAASSKKRRQRVKRNATAAQRNSQKSQNARVLASRTTAQQSAQLSSMQKGSSPKSLDPRRGKQKVSQKKSLSARVQANRVQAKRASGGAKRRANRVSMRAASRRQPVVSVVPASERHALDWTQGSLAHQMDVRHQRRAM